MKCELCGAKDEDFIVEHYIHQCLICKKWECEFCIYHDGIHPHKEKKK